MSIVSEDGKQAVTRRGHPVRVLCTDAPGNYPIVGICKEGDVATWATNGKFNTDESKDSTMDLVDFTPSPPSPLEVAARKVVAVADIATIVEGGSALGDALLGLATALNPNVTEEK